MKKLISLVAATVVCLALSAVFTACDEERIPANTDAPASTNENTDAPASTDEAHSHAYKTEWSKDDTHHWHECEGEACSDVADKAEHVWNEGEIKTEATKDADGEKLYTCTVCQATKGESVQFSGISEEKWNQVIQTANFDNITFGYKATFTSGYTDDVGPHASVFKLDGDRMSMDGETETDPETITAAKTWYIESALAIVKNFDKFTYDKVSDSYKATENIVYTVTIMGYEATITAANVSVELNADMNIAEIACTMTQAFTENGTPTTYVLDVEFTFADYGTTVVD